MRVTASCPELARLRARYREAPRIVQDEMRRAVPAAGRVLQRETRAHVPVETGKSRSSVFFRMENVGSINLRGRLTIVGGHGTPFQRELMVYLERGTKPHKIRPRRKKALRFMAGGSLVFAREVDHPGTPAFAPFARGFSAALPTMRRIFAAANGRVTKRLGRRGT